MDNKTVSVRITEGNKLVYNFEENLGKDVNSLSHIIPHVEIMKGKVNDFLTLIVKNRETDFDKGEPQSQTESQPRKKKSK